MIAATLATVLLGPQLTRLANGIPVVVDTGGKDTVTLQVLVRADDLTPSEQGAVEVMAAALFGETENYSLREFRRLAWSIGGAVVSEYAGDCIRVQITTTPNRLRPAAAFISDALRRPAFTQEALDQAAQNRARYLGWLNRTPPLADIRAALALTGLGPSNVERLTPTQARAIHSMVVRPERVSIAVVGKVLPDTVASVLGSSLGLWQPDAPFQSPVLPTSPATIVGQFRTALVTVKGPVPKAAGFAAWIVACIAIGEGKQGLLNRTFRIQSPKSYILGSYFTLRANASYCTFYVSTTREPPATLRQLVGQWSPTAAEANRAKAYTIGRYKVGGPTEVGRMGGFSVGHETEQGRAFWLAWWLMKGAGSDKDAGFESEVNALTQEKVAQAVRDWMAD